MSYHICTCECHDPGSAVMHFVPCCDGTCGICGVAYHGLREHRETEHKEELILAKKGRKRRWTDAERDKRGY